MCEIVGVVVVEDAKTVANTLLVEHEGLVLVVVAAEMLIGFSANSEIKNNGYSNYDLNEKKNKGMKFFKRVKNKAFEQ